MTNPQENPGTPPQPTPSDSTTPPPPSTTPKPRLRRVKMLARKTVASGALLKKLNEQLKASQAQNSDSDSDSESYKSASEGEGTGSSNSEKVQKFPSKETIEESDKKLGGSGSGEAAEELVNLSSQGDELGSLVEETLADLLKKASSPTPTETSLPKGRATRSRVKQSESDLQKALAESKKKRMDKGKGKVAESSEAVDVEEMEQVHQEKVTTLEVQTPKPKKAKTSSKKSSSMSEDHEPSLAKRTRSAVKSKQVRVSEDEEWSGDEESESDGEQDKLVMFGKRNFIKGRLLKDLVEPGMIRLVNTLAAQGWKDMVLQMDGRMARNKIIEFMANVEVKDDRVTSKVKGVQVTFDAEKLG
ncbi:uncharacterized protein [Nicotiana sylvestris]|uniref:uncharacterized protein n=1 Tax=Nicotiana sylvestris TaxID=4096 RepID=UPI00388CA18F